MAKALEALKEAVELERSALEQYKIALEHTQHNETKEALKGYMDDKQQKIDTLSWFVMAETGDLETTDEAPKAASKCPFSGQLAEMGIDISQMKPPTFDNEE